MTRVPHDPDDLNSMWRSDGDGERAVRISEAVLRFIVRDPDLPIGSKLELLEAAAEAMLDAEHGRPMMVYSAASALSKEVQGKAMTGDIPFTRLLQYKVRLAKFKARGLHCDGRSAQAFPHFLAALTALENEVGGREPLHLVLGHRPPNAIAEAFDEVFGIGCAALGRAFEVSDPTRVYWTGEVRHLVDATIPGLDAAAAHVYPGSASRIQAFYLLAKTGNPVDSERIEALRAFDMRVRATDRRGQATIALREAAYAEFVGSDAAFDAAALAARDALSRQGLSRHLRVVEEQGYLEKKAS